MACNLSVGRPHKRVLRLPFHHVGFLGPFQVFVRQGGHGLLRLFQLHTAVDIGPACHTCEARIRFGRQLSSAGARRIDKRRNSASGVTLPQRAHLNAARPCPVRLATTWLACDHVGAVVEVRIMRHGGYRTASSIATKWPLSK
jgi:hypothetical protein